MRPVATCVTCSVVCMSACVLGTRMNCSNTAEPIEMPYGTLTHMRVGPRNNVVDRTNPFAYARGDKSAMRPFYQFIMDICYSYAAIIRRINIIIIQLFADVPAKPSFLMTPQDQVIAVGRRVILRCKVTGNPVPAVFWNKQSSQVSSSSH